MSDRIPILEQIAQRVKTALDAVSFSLETETVTLNVIRPTRLGGYSPEHLLCVLEQADWKDAGDAPCGYVRRMVPFTAGFFLKPSDASTTPIDYIENVVAAEIEAAIMADQTCNGLAEQVLMTDPDSAPTTDGAYWYHGVNFEVTYAHPHDNPF